MPRLPSPIACLSHSCGSTLTPSDASPEEYFIFHYFLVALHSMCNLSPPARDQTYTPCSGSMDLNQWTTRGVPSARRSNQSTLKEINPKHSLEGLMVKLKLQYVGYLMRGADSLEKTLMLGKIEPRPTLFPGLGGQVPAHEAQQTQVRPQALWGRQGL